MVVAEVLDNPTTHRIPAPLLSHAFRAFEPRHHGALIPTAWGLAAAVWTVPPDDAARGETFSQKPASALLAAILTPGLACPLLRETVLERYPGCREVLGDGHGNFHPEVVPDWFPQLVGYLQQYYTSGLRDPIARQFVDHWSLWSPRLDWAAVTLFQRQVLECVARIPTGHQRTYGEIARDLGKPRASRAVGAALGRNPWPVLVPCHRVLGAGGVLTGFSAPGGVDTKRRMLDHERISLHA